MNFKKLGALLIFICTTNVYAARYEQAAYNLDNGKYEQALTQFTELATLGNKDAQYMLALMYFRGNGVPANHLKAYAWFKIAGTKGDEDANSNAKKLYNAMSPELRERANTELQKLTSIYSDAAIEARIYPDTDQTKSGSWTKEPLPLRVKTPQYPKRALHQSLVGEATIRFDVGKDGRTKNHSILSYSDNLFIKPSLDAARGIIYQPGEVDGKIVELTGVEYRFVYKMANQDPDEKKVKKYLDELQQKATRGTSIDRFKYAQSISVLSSFMTDEVMQSYGSANQWYVKAAVDGLPQAKYQIGLATFYGKQCYREQNKSDFWLSSAANDGLTTAQVFLGMRKLESEDQAQIQEGLELLKAAAEADDALALLEYAKALAFPPTAIKPNFAAAQKLLEQINEKEFADPISLYEAKFMLYSKVNKTKQTQKAEKQLAKALKKYDLPKDIFMQNISNQIEGKPLRVLVENTEA